VTQLAAHKSYDRKKRVFDVGVALLLYVLSLPLQAAVALAIVVRLGRPVLFRQARPGLHGTVFTLVKFRSMRPAAVDEGVSSDAVRLTPLGRFLRATSLDELPTLVNVIKGDMSMVGPRPLLVSYVDRYSPEQARRHEVRPGVTGLAQVNGRNALIWEEKLKLDVEYVDNRTFALDLQILRATVLSVLRRSGVTAAGQATMTEFQGTDARGGS
jgi:lipopolysaccharide/colanic/teichoic acid biosynthesis glycosyltransferase